MRALVPLLALLLLATPGAAEELWIDIPSFAGTWIPPAGPPGHDTRLELPEGITLVRSAAIHVVGQSAPARVLCEGQDPYDRPVYFEFAAPTGCEETRAYARAELPIGGVDARIPLEFGSFADEVCAGGWNFLLEGVRTLELCAECVARPAICTELTPAALITTQAWLVLDVERVVPATAASWGALKALYRERP